VVFTLPESELGQIQTAMAQGKVPVEAANSQESSKILGTGTLLTPNNTISTDNLSLMGLTVDASTTGMSEILPGMRTDIVLTFRARERRIVIDTKFSTIVKPGWHRDELLQSSYLYQIYAYLRSQEGDAIADRAEGLLLHPAIDGQLVDEAVRMQGHIIRFSTVDLSATAAAIRERWLHVVEKPGLPFN